MERSQRSCPRLQLQDALTYRGQFDLRAHFVHVNCLLRYALVDRLAQITAYTFAVFFLFHVYVTQDEAVAIEGLFQY